MAADALDTGLCACGRPLPPRAARGPARRYCSSRCRSAASRARRAGFAGELAAPAPLEPAGALLVGKCKPGSTDAQVCAVVHELIILAATMHRLSREARRPFAWRCAGMAEVIDAGLSRYFKTADL
jgi:hypothetical protein